MSRNITKEDVHKRIKDWEIRIQAQYANIGEWFQQHEGLITRPGLPVTLYQEVMVYFSVPTREMPTLDLLHENRLLLTLKPVALWLIGGNGRIDLLLRGRKTAWFIVDRAEPFDTPDWILFSINDEVAPVRFTRESLMKILQELM